ncbi:MULTISPECIES: 50S ribosomal protein L25/general stress protein Ctc [Brevibacterium]|jgi:large subunit ribosomal protein L25|uniref:Large ribosomal subunit protein bL25 n=1 Tax=Brevibacterium salitolerans TaxID=1403566 RepID=A0ABP5HUR3_9MICO|nr:50S ribosomal protein L25/general stress protein Ctc [Brevibacterium sp.]
MADTIKLLAAKREEFGKGASRRDRRAGKIPAVLYGHGTEPEHLLLEGHATMLALRNANALLELENAEGTRNELALPKDVQVHPVSREIEHVDLIIVKRGEKVEVEIPVHVVGEAAPGTLVSHEATTLLLEADALKLPEHVEVSIEGREAGEHVYAADVVLPKGTTLAGDPELLVVNVSAEISEAQLEAELESDAVEGDAVPASQEDEGPAEPADKE